MFHRRDGKRQRQGEWEDAAENHGLNVKQERDECQTVNAIADGHAKKLARDETALTPTGVKSRQWFGQMLLVALAWIGVLGAQVPELDLPRPGLVVATDVTGEVTAVAGEQRRILKPNDGVRVGATVITGRRSVVTLSLSNGVTLQLGSEAELELEEFGQAPYAGSIKFAELKEEPTLSRTRLRLVGGDVTVKVKPLKASGGSTFSLSTLAGTVRGSDGAFRMMIRMHDLGLGICSVEVQAGTMEFEPTGGGAVTRVPVGRSLELAIEVDQAGAVKLGEMPKPTAKPPVGK